MLRIIWYQAIREICWRTQGKFILNNNNIRNESNQIKIENQNTCVCVWFVIWNMVLKIIPKIDGVDSLKCLKVVYFQFYKFSTFFFCVELCERVRVTCVTPTFNYCLWKFFDYLIKSHGNWKLKEMMVMVVDESEIEWITHKTWFPKSWLKSQYQWKYSLNHWDGRGRNQSDLKARIDFRQIIYIYEWIYA